MRAIRKALRLIENACSRAEDQVAGCDIRAALVTLADGMADVIDALAPYAKAMPLPYPHTILILTNGSTIRTTANAPADIAGMINAGTQKIYDCTDLTDGLTHHVMVSAILDFYQVTS